MDLLAHLNQDAYPQESRRSEEPRTTFQLVRWLRCTLLRFAQTKADAHPQPSGEMQVGCLAFALPFNPSLKEFLEARGECFCSMFSALLVSCSGENACAGEL